ncbi:unnamed protein product [Rangifer tarandus platyrhynchus]|uniref:Uncharacterized protein n=1 Tax=Rangifer tarandus platyrhynchus TaxID=3082113 RepID=A0ABN8YC66_RANTA|nr:unnamed protein product [Rangifer tarandus platyrhynchus]
MKSGSAESGRRQLLPLSASFSPSVRREDRPGGSPSALRAPIVWFPPRRHSCSYLGRCAGAQGAGSRGVGGGRGTGTAQSFPAPLRRRNPRREEPVRVCAGERLARSIDCWRPTLRRGRVAGHRAWPAPRPRHRRLASLLSALSAAAASGTRRGPPPTRPPTPLH